ncbi:MAG: T9SS type A sorting domain-containing protein [Bacteroidota bacterium]|nr:T9SS type A sorting domain-containing protein [Bacteroidota bacterium]
MRFFKDIFLFCFFLIGSNFYCQINFNRAYHNVQENSSPLFVELFNDYYFTTISTSSYQFGNNYLYKINPSGNLIYRKLILTEQAQIKQSLKSLDNKLIILSGIEGWCDYGDTSKYRSYITKLDTGGNIVFNLKIKRIFGTTYLNFTVDNIKTLVQQSDSNYYAFTDSVMYKISKVGNIIFQKNLGLNSIKTSLALQNGNILLSAKIGTISNLVEVNTVGSIINQQVAPLFNKLLYYNSNQSYMGLSNVITKISPSYQSFATSSFNISDIAIKSDTIFYVSNSGNSASYHICDTSFSSIYSTTNTTQNFNAKYISLSNNKISIIGDGLSYSVSPATNYFTSFSNLNKYSSFNFSNDASVCYTSIDTANVTFTTYTAPNFTSTVYNINAKLKVWVKNNSILPLTSVKLNYYNNNPFFCGKIYWQKEYTSLNIAPADSIQLITDFIYTKINPSGPLQSNINVNYCVYSTLPNEEHDKIVYNDGLCKSFNLNVPVGLKENNLAQTTAEIYPIPFTSCLTIKSSNPITTFEIRDLLGELIYDNVIVNSDDIILDNINLNQGIFFIKLNFKNGQYISKKIIKN